MNKLYQAMLQLLKKDESFVQATILTQSGSAPRTAGAKMLVLPDGSIQGTIGGGLVEAKVQELAAEVFKTKESVTRSFNLSGSDKAKMDMICGGNLEVLIEYMDASDKHLLSVYKNITSAIENRKRLVLVTPIASEPGEANRPFLVAESGLLTGDFSGPAEWLSKFASLTGGRYPQVLIFGAQRFLVEPISTYGTVYVFGAGHVSQKLALITALVDFKTVVIDDRKEFANTERFAMADEVLVVESFEHSFETLQIDRDSYLVIVTRGHAHDKTVLAQALRTNARYIGMIGSKKKRDTIYRVLREEGFTEQDINRVYSPIGIEIEAETPEEIAVSITAELIKVRAGQV